jgi:shikimate kinase
MPKVVLIGFMGSGKSTVATRLGELLKLPVCEMDAEIVGRSGLASIPEIFEKRGEQHFRDLEAEVAQGLAQASDIIISTGGGVIGRAGNMESLKASGGVIVFLRSSFETVRARNEGLETRPLFRDGAKALDLFGQRAPLYARWADIMLDTDSRTVSDLCAEIISRLESLACPR